MARGAGGGHSGLGRRALLALIPLLMLLPACGSEQRTGTALAGGRDPAEAYADLPLAFEPNVGQAPAGVSFVSRGDGYSLSLTATEAALSLQGGGVVQMSLVGTDPAPAMAGGHRLPGTSNYLRGPDRSQWQVGVPRFAKVDYQAVYPGIDLVFYGNQRRLEYDFVVAPGADPGVIRVRFDGGSPPAVHGDGSLVLTTAGGTVVQHPPTLYQDIAGLRTEVRGGYVVDGHEVGFSVGTYDKALPLVIDPVLDYSIYLGGNWGSGLADIAVDAAGNAYVAGTTGSTDFPIVNAVQPTLRSNPDVFVSKLNASGTALVYSTFLGGSDVDLAAGIGIDASGQAAVGGTTGSHDFPTTAGSVQPAFAGGSTDAFVTKLSASGSALVYSTYLGGTGDERATAFAADPSGNGYLAGETRSSDFPTVNARQPSPAGGTYDGFVAKLNPSGSTLAYSTYLGGSGLDTPEGITADGAGNAYVVGRTTSANFPLLNALQPVKRATTTAFVTKLDASGALVYSTFLGGSVHDEANDVAVDGSGNAYVVGFTDSPDFPVLNAAQSVHRGLHDGFVTKLNSSGSALVYSTFIGGSGYDRAEAVTVDGAGRASVTGSTTSHDFPVVEPLQAYFAGGEEYGDAWVATLSPAGSSLTFGTYLGGASIDSGLAIGVDAAGNLYVGGVTYMEGFPMVRSLPGVTGPSGAFVAKIVPGPSATTTVSPSSAESGGQVTAAGTGLEPGAAYVLVMAPNPSQCSTGVRLGGPVTAGANGVIPPTVRTIPGNATPGTRYLCWVSAEDASITTAADAVVVF